MNNNDTQLSVDGLYTILPLKTFRKTEGVTFDLIPQNLVPNVSSIDRVIHKNNATSPGPVSGIIRPWYMHPGQEDNLVVLYGERYVDLYTPAHGTIEHFTVTPHGIYHNDKALYEGDAILAWPCNVFHRVRSSNKGSASVNLAVHREGFDIKTNFNIYDVNTETGEYWVVREGHKDQF